MKYIKSDNIVINKPTAITLGNFDGIHLGHRALINTVVEQAKKRNLISVVCSFIPHPKFIFKTENNFALILNHDEKLKRIEELNVDIFAEFPFSKEFADLDPEEFAQEYIYKNMNCRFIVVGSDYMFGKGRKGNTELLREIGKKYGAEVVGIDEITVDNEVVSSTRVRKLLRAGEMEKVNEILYKPYSITGVVHEGRKLGRSIGFPTANIIAESDRVFPPNGVYVTKVIIDGVFYNGVTNIGFNPTVNGNVKTVETHILDFNSDIYGKTIEVQFFKFTRPETKFKTIEELKEQISLDKSKAKDYLKTN